MNYHITSHICAVFFCLTIFLVLFLTVSDYGITWDEAEINFPAARCQVQWLKGMINGDDLFNEHGIHQYFETESDHPSLPRSLMALSRLILPGYLPDRAAFAFPILLLASLFSGYFFLIAKRYTNYWGGFVSLLLLFSHSRWFGHAHFAEYDILIAMAWFISAISFYTAVEGEKSGEYTNFHCWTRYGWASIWFGVALSTKVHAFFIPFPILVWVIWYKRWNAWKWFVLSIFIAPLIYIGTQPYLWWHTIERLLNRFHDYGTKVPISVFYIGKIYPGDTPWHYPFVMLLVTLPLPFLFLVILGIFSHIGTLRKSESETVPNSSWITFLLLNAATLPLVFSIKSAYDGIRFFLSSLPFLALLTAESIRYLSQLCAESPQRRLRHLFLCLFCGCLVGSQIIPCIRIHPYHLSYYSGLVGGLAGANSAGFESTYWCDAITPDFISQLTAKIPDNARIGTHAFDPAPLREYQRMGLVPQGWTFVKEEPADCRIIMYRQGFFGVSERRLITERTPLLEVSRTKVPLVQAFAGP